MRDGPRRTTLFIERQLGRLELEKGPRIWLVQRLSPMIISGVDILTVCRFPA